MYLFFFFLLVSIAYDFLIRETSLLQIFRTTRNLGFFVFFMLINSFEFIDYQRFFKTLIIFTVLHSIIYLSQYLIGFSYTGLVLENEVGGSRYGGVPPYIIPSLIICLFINFNSTLNNFKKILAILFCIVILMSQSRGVISSALAIFIMYALYEHKLRFRTLIVFSILSAIVYFAIQSFLPVIQERFSNLITSIGMMNEMDHTKLEAFFHEGSIIFRWGLTYERFLYVLEDPIRILLGVGYLPDIDLVTPIFILGTFSPMLPLGFEQFNSVDILFPNIITRYGLLGSVLFLLMLYRFLRVGKLVNHSSWGEVYYVYFISLCLISFVSESFYNGQYFLMIFFLLGISIKHNRHVSLVEK
jgi:hypothetical protein